MWVADGMALNINPNVTSVTETIHAELQHVSLILNTAGLSGAVVGLTAAPDSSPIDWDRETSW